MAGPIGQGHEGRDGRSDGALNLGHDRPDARMAADRRAVATGPAAQALIAVVSAVAADDRANDRELVHHRGDAGKALADLQAGDAGGNRAELAANLLGSVGLDFPHVLMWRAAGQKDVDDGFVP